MRPPYSISAVILARGGSKGIPKKNLQEISGMSLVGRTISAAKSSKFLKGIYLSTDDSLIADEGKRSGATIIHRPAKISNDKASSEVGWLHALEEIQAINKQIDFLVFLQCTSPFTTGEDIDGCINALLNSNASCSISVIPDHSFVWAVNEHGFGEGVNHDVSRQRLRRQDMAPYFGKTERFTVLG